MASTPEGEAVFRLMLEVLQTFHRLRAVGAEEGGARPAALAAGA